MISTVSEEVLAAIDKLAGLAVSRSAFIECVLRAFVRERQRDRTEARELVQLNRHAARLNAEAADVLGYQAPWPGE